MWSLWQQSQTLGVTPSSIIGLTPGSYEAFCFDQASFYFGMTIQAELEKAGQGKKPKGEAQREAARKRVLAKYLGDEKKSSKGQFADPAALFSTS